MADQLSTDIEALNANLANKRKDKVTNFGVKTPDFHTEKAAAFGQDKTRITAHKKQTMDTIEQKKREADKLAANKVQLAERNAELSSQIKIAIAKNAISETKFAESSEAMGKLKATEKKINKVKIILLREEREMKILTMKLNVYRQL
ncbi:MAG: TPP-dependent trihydroxycyclohexane-1,2-dione (THcHDO) dehydratase [Crocinitomix sp.]|jgi:TPP-dependent trihydroxycyclohexane-1,2-dione (THcHDO) dehydratase